MAEEKNNVSVNETEPATNPAAPAKRARRAKPEEAPESGAELTAEQKRELSLKKLGEVNGIDGFYPESLYEPVTTDDGTVLQKLPVKIRLGWFYLKYPEGRIDLDVREERMEGGNRFIACARVFRNMTDEHYIAIAYASRRFDPSLPNVSPREWAQTAAIGIALRNAGFGLLTDIATDIPSAKGDIDDNTANASTIPVEEEPVHDAEKLKAATADVASEVSRRRKRNVRNESDKTDASAPAENGVPADKTATDGNPDGTADEVATDGNPDITEKPNATPTGEPAASEPTDEEAPLNPTKEQANAALMTVYKTSSKSLAEFNGKTFREILTIATPDKPDRGRSFVRWLAHPDRKDAPYHTEACILLAFSENHRK